MITFFEKDSDFLKSFLLHVIALKRFRHSSFIRFHTIIDNINKLANSIMHSPATTGFMRGRFFSFLAFVFSHPIANFTVIYIFLL